ncbi:hypothetical protein [Natronincola ferrireducens]|uniref:hypothetical protein n=1 Tax=Natronincola ferrireducens TaxID=393762 RepID=UPI0015A3D6DD|nr:hypothetical protein [Natronincola ferrireducens]
MTKTRIHEECSSLVFKGYINRELRSRECMSKARSKTNVREKNLKEYCKVCFRG